MVDIRQRAVLVAPNERETKTIDPKTNKVISITRQVNGVIVCAEPSPDAMAALAYELAVKGDVAQKAGGELSLGMQDSAAFTGLRTQSIQLLRDFGYRLCESHLSGAISADQYDLLMRRFQKNTVALLAIEQLTGAIKAPPIVLTSQGSAEASKSLTEQRAVSEGIGDQIAQLEKKKASLEKQKVDNETKSKNAKTANATADTSEFDKKSTELGDEIKDLEGKDVRLKSDKQEIDKGIANTKGVIAGGKTNVTIDTDSLPAQRSDQHIQTVANIVGKIVNNIVLSDDTMQICMGALQSPPGDQYNIGLKTWCLRSLNNEEDSQEKLRAEIYKALTEAWTRYSKAQAGEQENIRKEIDELLKKLMAISNGADAGDSSAGGPVAGAAAAPAGGGGGGGNYDMRLRNGRYGLRYIK